MSQPNVNESRIVRHRDDSNYNAFSEHESIRPKRELSMLQPDYSRLVQEDSEDQVEAREVQVISKTLDVQYCFSLGSFEDRRDQHQLCRRDKERIQPRSDSS